MQADVVVVGAGILGLATARELLARQPDRKVVVLEREPEVGFHQTGHNRGVIHGGIYYAPGSPKARLRSADGDELAADQAVFCAGPWSDRLALEAGADADPRIVPFRGAYLTLRPERTDLVKSLIYPVPDPTLPFLGVHLSRHVDDEVTIGPTALLAGARDPRRKLSAADVGATLAWPGSWKMVRRWWRTGLTEIKHALSKRALVRDAQRYVPELQLDDVQPGHFGIRAQALGRDGRLIDDFVFNQTGQVLHVRNAPSPGATASLAIAREIVDRLESGPFEPTKRAPGES